MFLEQNLILDLNGNFKLRTDKGDVIGVNGGMKPAMLAMLATASDMKRSRDWLISHLWPRSKSASSLRKLVQLTREDLGIYSDVLESTKTHLGLKGVRLAAWRAEEGRLFFEDAPRLQSPLFEEWLRTERSRHEVPITTRALAPLLPGRERNPCVVMMQPHVVSDIPGYEQVVAMVCDQIVTSLRSHGMVDVFDLRDLDSNQLAMFGGDQLPNPDVQILVRFSKIGQQSQLSIIAKDANTNRVLWTLTEATDSPRQPPFSLRKLTEMAGQTVDGVHDAALSRDGRMSFTQSSEGRALFSAVHSILGMSVEGQEIARSILCKRLETERSPVVGAWYAFSFANSVGERGRGIDAAFFEQAEHHCARALETGSNNGLVLALTAHVYGFVLRRFEVAAELAEMARKRAPGLALAWDVSAMNAIYTDRVDEGYEFALKATKLGRFSPFKPYFDASLAIGGTLTGRHREAIDTAKGLLQRRPGFLGVMRHMAASLAQTDQLAEAERCIREIRLRDPEFVEDRIHDPDYPLPSIHSKQLIAHVLKTCGR